MVRSAQYTNILLLTLVTDHLAVYFASAVVTSNAGESVLFVLQSRTKEASLAPLWTTLGDVLNS